MAIIYVGTRSKNLPDSGAWQIHKFGTATGEQRIALDGSWVTDKNLFDFYLKDVEFYFFTKSDLLDYISSIQEEINFPTQTYSYKGYPTFYNDKKSEIIDYPSDFITLHFEANPRAGGTPYLSTVSEEDSNIYNFFRSICLSSAKQGKNNAYTTYHFVKYQDTKNGKFYINLVPTFSKKYTMKELANILQRTLIGAADPHVACYLFGLKYAEQINSAECKGLIEEAGFNDEKLVEDLEMALKVFNQLKTDEVTINPISHKRSLLGAYIDQTTEKIATILPDEPLQKITYGAPGTGKSHGTNEVVRNYKDTIRTTFHPDSDYSTFVGSYKPTTTKEPVLGLFGKDTVQLTYPNIDTPLETTKIVYKFIKQAFLKAYILAWKKMCAVGVCTSTGALVANRGKVTYTVHKVEKDKVICKKEEGSFPKKAVSSVWETLWESGTFVMPTGGQSGQSIQQAISQWIYDLSDVNAKEDFENGWKKLIAELRTGQKINVKKNVKRAQTYILTYNDDDETVKVISFAGSGRDAIEKCYNGGKHRNSVEEISKILKGYELPTFEEAWEKLVDDVNNRKTTKTITVADEIEPQFLVIEEINRGNCAQIFGDLFQLLDRKNGYSEYPIEADEDIQKALLDENPDDELSFGKDGLTLPDAIVAELQEIYEDSEDDVVEKICKGKVLVLPKNLYIWATMNTSDQSLFPIDSAFKRRWDWEYKPIIKPADKNWKIQVGPGYEWWTFLEEVNKIINELTSSEDKKLGYFFAKAKKVGDEEVVDIDAMVNKVFFYLWNDVFKDYDLGHLQSFPKIKEDTSKTDSKERPYSFGDFFDKKEGKFNKEAVEDFMKAFMPNTATTTTATATTAAGTTPQEPTEQTTE